MIDHYEQDAEYYHQKADEASGRAAPVDRRGTGSRSAPEAIGSSDHRTFSQRMEDQVDAGPIVAAFAEKFLDTRDELVRLSTHDVEIIKHETQYLTLTNQISDEVGKHVRDWVRAHANRQPG